MQDFLNQTFYGNTVYNYAVAVGIFILGIIVLIIFKKIILSRLKKWSEKTVTTVDDFLVRGIEKSVVPVLYLINFYLAIITLNLPREAKDVIDKVIIILATFFFKIG